MIKIGFNLKFFAVMNVFMALGAVMLMILILIFMLYLAKKNFRDFRNNDATVSYLYTYSPSKSKFRLISTAMFCIIMFIFYFGAFIFVGKYVVLPIAKDVPKLIVNDYEYTTGIVDRVQSEKTSNIIYINDVKIYETKIFINGKIKQGHKYKIAYLKNTKRCVGFEEL